MPSIALLGPSGEVLDRIPISAEGLVVGREAGLLWESDPYLSPAHVHIAILPSGRFRVTDQQSFNGTYHRVVAKEKLDDGAMLRMGKQCLRFSRLMPWSGSGKKPWAWGASIGNAWGRLASVIDPTQEGSAVLLAQPTVRLGRTTGEIRFPADEYMSGNHAAIAYQQGQAFIEDVGSRNGTFLRMHEPKTLPAGTLLLVGQQRVHLEVSTD